MSVVVVFIIILKTEVQGLNERSLMKKVDEEPIRKVGLSSLYLCPKRLGRPLCQWPVTVESRSYPTLSLFGIFRSVGSRTVVEPNVLHSITPCQITGTTSLDLLSKSKHYLPDSFSLNLDLRISDFLKRFLLTVLFTLTSKVSDVTPEIET